MHILFVLAEALLFFTTADEQRKKKQIKKHYWNAETDSTNSEAVDGF